MSQIDDVVLAMIYLIIIISKFLKKKHSFSD